MEMKVEMEMKMEQIFHMKGGKGEESYATNSKTQKDCLSKSTPILEQAVVDLCNSTSLPEHVVVADLGCSSGPNSVAAVAKITGTMFKTCREMGRTPPEMTVLLNDLRSNDFNTVFMSLPAFHEKMRQECGPDFRPCYTAAVPGSFYGRLFPPRTLHFVHSSFSVHWLSQVPPELTDKENPLINKGKIYISKSSPPQVINAYASQFQRDFSSFLRCRSEEIVPNGRMVVTLIGRMALDPTAEESCLLWDYMGQAFQELVLEGLIEEEKLDSYNTPFYEPCREEISGEIEREGSFTLDRLAAIPITWDPLTCGKTSDRIETAKQMAKAIRAVNESMFRNHFGDQILDTLFERFTQIMAKDTKVVGHVSMLLSLVRKN